MRDEALQCFEQMMSHWRIIAVVAGLMEMTRKERKANDELDRQTIADAARLILEQAQAARQCLSRMRGKL